MIVSARQFAKLLLACVGLLISYRLLCALKIFLKLKVKTKISLFKRNQCLFLFMPILVPGVNVKYVPTDFTFIWSGTISVCPRPWCLLSYKKLAHKRKKSNIAAKFSLLAFEGQDAFVLQKSRTCLGKGQGFHPECTPQARVGKILSLLSKSSAQAEQKRLRERIPGVRWQWKGGKALLHLFCGGFF